MGSSNLQTTVDERPQVLIYTPYRSEETATANFSLQLGDDEIYQANINLPKKAGVFAIALPSSAPVLQFDRNYRWYVDINCSSANKSRDSLTPASLTGVIRRIKLDPLISQKLQVAKTPIERIHIYAQHGIWMNAVSELAKERIKAPLDRNLKQIWVSLLSQPEVGLEKVSQEPIVVH